MGYILLITEKPSSAKKIAEALADGKAVKKSEKSVPYYEITRGNQDIVVVPAVGHLYGLAEIEKSKGFAYPVFDIEWKPIADVRKEAAYSKKYLNLIKKLAKKADEFVLATDFDIEGETLGYNIVRYACKQPDAKRMKFSALTKHDLNTSFDNLLPTIEWGQAEAGVTRHTLDWYYGINLSRALTTAIKKAGMFKILSTGRVQGPALKIIVDKEKEIKAFVPTPYWELHLAGKHSRKKVAAQHKKGKFEDKKEANSVFKKVKSEKEAKVSEVKATQQKQRAPTPMDLTTLQTEAHRSLGIPPKRTLDVAQNLYLRGLISYPRTSSQQLPPTIGYRAILSKVAKQLEYKELADILLSKNKLAPANGKKKDPAHPAIYPTGVIPKALEGQDKRIYDLVVRRFMATFGENAVRETVTVTMDVKGEPFVSKGTRTVEPGWHIYYGPHVKLSEEELPKMEEGDQIKVDKIEQIDKETQPPRRFSESSIIRELEKRNLGTKATRANIIDTLANRQYVTGKALEATQLGIEISDTLSQHVPKIVDEALTRFFEEEMEQIRGRKKKVDVVLEEAREVLLEILDVFKKKEDDIGKQLHHTFTETRALLTTLGPCLACREGSIQIRKGKYGRFAACNKYPDCTQTYKLPKGGMLKPTDKQCEKCQHPIVQAIKARRKPQEVCINPDCPEKTLATPELEGSTCPKCNENKLVTRKSIYGHFLACGGFPKCFYLHREKKAGTEEKAEKTTKKPTKKKTTKKKTKK